MRQPILKLGLLWCPPSLLFAILLATFLLPKPLIPWIYGIGASLGLLFVAVLWTVSTQRRTSRRFGRAFLSLVAMKGTTSLPLILTGVVAFYWLVDFLREMNWFGSLFSFSLLWATLSTVVFWETQQSESFVSPPGLPLKTRGLIISLSGLAPPVKADVDKRIQSIRDAGIGPEELRRKLGAAISLKVAGKTDRDELNTLLDPKGDSSGKVILDLLEPLLKIPLYTPLAAIGHHFERLEKTWVLRTARAKQEAWETFEQLISLFFPEKQPEPVDVRDPNNVAEVSSTVNAIYGDAQRAGIPEGDVTADITGGTASMSAGIILACVRSKRRVQYLRQDNFTLQPVDVTVRTIPWLVEEFIEQLELIRQ